MGKKNKILIHQSSPFKKMFDALKYLEPSSINFIIDKDGIKIQDQLKNGSLYFQVDLSSHRIQIHDIDEEITFSIPTHSLDSFIKSIPAKQVINLKYREKEELKILKYTCSGKTRGVVLQENDYIKRFEDNYPEIPRFEDVMNTPTCILSGNDFKNIFSDFKNIKGEVEIYAQKNGILFKPITEIGAPAMECGNFKKKFMNNTEKTFKVLTYNGPELYRLHKCSSSSGIVRIYAYRNEDIQYPLLFKFDIGNIGSMDVLLVDEILDED